MNVIKIIQIVNLIAASCICMFILIDLFIKKRKMKSDKNYNIDNNKYVIMIVILSIQFSFYGIMRNFE